jgi:hypothetical protein
MRQKDDGTDEASNGEVTTNSMLMDLARERFTEATVDHLVAVAVFGLPYRGCPFATVPDRHLRDTPLRTAQHARSAHSGAHKQALRYTIVLRFHAEDEGRSSRRSTCQGSMADIVTTTVGLVGNAAIQRSKA